MDRSHRLASISTVITTAIISTVTITAIISTVIFTTTTNGRNPTSIPLLHPAGERSALQRGSTRRAGDM